MARFYLSDSEIATIQNALIVVADLNRQTAKDANASTTEGAHIRDCFQQSEKQYRALAEKLSDVGSMSYEV